MKKKKCTHSLYRVWDVLLPTLTATTAALCVIIGAVAIINQISK